MYGGLCQWDASFGPAHFHDGVEAGIGKQQGVGVCQSDVLGSGDDKATGYESGVFAAFHHACQPVDGSVGVAAANGLDEGGDDVVVHFAVFVVGKGILLEAFGHHLIGDDHRVAGFGLHNEVEDVEQLTGIAATVEKCPVPDKGWRYPSTTFSNMLGTNEPVELLPNMVVKGQIVFTTGRKGNNQPRNKYLLKENLLENTPSIINDGTSNDKLFKELGIDFEYPKTLAVAKYLLKNVLPNSEIILDFFAGSGTTLHATMQLNAEDSGHRKCILVTNNENNICEEVTYKRNKRVINGYTTPRGEEVPGLKNNTLRYYRTSFVGRSRSMKNMRQLMSLSTDMLCIKEDLYTEQPKFGEQPTYKNVFRYFDNGRKRMMVIYREEAVQQLVELIQKTDYEGKMLVYVFSPSEDPWEGEFEEVQDRVQLCALPQAIYNAYRRILPKKKDEFVGADETKATGQANVTDGTLNFDNEEELQ